MELNCGIYHKVQLLLSTLNNFMCMWFPSDAYARTLKTWRSKLVLYFCLLTFKTVLGAKCGEGYRKTFEVNTKYVFAAGKLEPLS